MIDAYITFIHNHLIVCLSVFITILPIMLIWRRKVYMDSSFRCLLACLMIKLIIDLVMFHYATKRVNNLILYNISIPIRYALLSSMFYFKIETKFYKKGILYSIAGFLIFSAWDIFYSNPDIKDLHNHHIAAYAATIECLLMLFWVLIYFYEIIRMLKIPNLLTFPFFWVCSGLLLYYSSFVFIAPVLHYSEQWENSLYIGLLDTIPYIFETLCLLFFSIGAWFFTKRDYAIQ
jgi:hypothetical protein